MWHLRCFGALKAEKSEQVIDRFRTQKTAALLALLAFRGSQSREALCAILWPDAAPEAARNSLSAALSSLRRDLGDGVLVADRQSVALVSGTVTTDVTTFDAALKAKDYACAVDLYQGHLLAGFHEDPFPSLAGEYEEKARGAFCARIEELERDAQPDALRSLARRAIALFGDDERWFLALMRAHHLASDLDAALRAYDALLRHARKLGEVASEDARQLAKLLRREKEQKEQTATSPALKTPSSRSFDEILIEPVRPSEPAPVVPSAPLPSQWTRFFGRESEREVLRDWLRRGERLITLSGAGGSGKTRLAIETLDAVSSAAVDSLHELEVEVAGPVHFVPLASLSDASLLLPSVRDALGLTVSSELPPQEQIARALNGTKSVLLLDNFEQLVPQGAAYLQSLREKLPDTTLMVTSRTLLRLPGERELPVAPLPTPLQQMPVEDIAACPSVQLFCDRSGLLVSDENAQAIGALCRRLDGIPLALELAAARARLLSPAQILERLEKHPDFLQSRELGIPARHKTLRATIEWSADLLSPELRAFFTRLSVFRGGWTLEAAEEVCQEFDAIESLTLLRESSLVRVENGEGETRFRMLETLREFGQDQLSPQEHEAVERAFFDYFLQLAQQAAHAMRGPAQTRWLYRLDVEQDNVRAALAWARDNDPQRGLQLATALIDFWETRLSLQEGRTWIETFLQATAPEPKTTDSAPVAVHISPAPSPLEVRSRALSGAGRLAWYSSDMAEAGALLEAGIEAAKSAGDSSSLIYATRTLARVTALAGEKDRSQTLGSDAVRLARESNEPQLLLEALTDLAFATVNAGDLSASAHACEEAIGIARRLSDERTLCLALLTRAAVAAYEPEEHKYRNRIYSLLDEGESLARKIGAPFELMMSDATRALVLTREKQFDLAQSFFNQSLINCRQSYLDSWITVNTLWAASYLFYERGEVEFAASILGGADALGQAIGYTIMPFLVPENTRYRNLMRASLGEAAYVKAWQNGQQLKPVQVLDLAIQTSSETPTEGEATLAVRARALSAVGRLASYSHELDTSRALLEQGLEAARRSGDTASFVHAVKDFGYFSMTTGDVEGDLARTCTLGEEAVAKSRAIGNDALLVEALFALGMARAVVAEFELGRIVTEEGIDVASKLGDQQRVAHGQNLLATIIFYAGDEKKARALLEVSLPQCRKSGDVWDLLVCLSMFSTVAREQGQLDVAYEASAECLDIARKNPSFYWGTSNLLLEMGYVRLRLGQAEKTARIIGAAEVIREASNYRLMPFALPNYDRYYFATRELLGEDAFEAAVEQGRSLSREEAIEDALSSGSAISGEKSSDDSEANALLSLRSQALSGVGRLAWYANDLSQADSYLEQGLQSAQQAGSLTAVIYATRSLARVTALAGDVERGRVLGREAVQLARRQGDAFVLQEALADLGFAEMNASDFAAASEVCEESLALARESGDEHAVTLALGTLAIVYFYQGKEGQLLACINESEPICRRLNARWELVICLALRGRVAAIGGQFDEAQTYFDETIAVCRTDSTVSWNLINVLCSVAYAFFRRGDFAVCVCLLGACDTMGESIGYSILPFMRAEHEQTLRDSRKALGANAYDVAWERGRAMDADATVEFARHPIVDWDTEVLTSEFKPFALPTRGKSQLADPTMRARALSGAGRMASHNGDLAAARELLEQGLEEARNSEDKASFIEAVEAFVAFSLTTGNVNDEITQSLLLSEEALLIGRESGDRSLLVGSLTSTIYSQVFSTVNDANSSRKIRELCAEGMALARDLNDDPHLTRITNCLAYLEYQQGNWETALVLASENLELCRRLKSSWDLLTALWMYSNVNREVGEYELSYDAIHEALELVLQHSDYRWSFVNLLLVVAYVSVRCGHAEEAATLLGATEALRQKSNYKVVPALAPEYARFLLEIRKTLRPGVFEALWRQGARMTTEQAVDFALNLDLQQRIVVPSTAETTDVSPIESARARALSAAGRLAWHGSDFEESRAFIEQGLDAARRLNDTPAFVEAVAAFVRLTMTLGDDMVALERADLLSKEAVQRSRAAENPSLLLESLNSFLYNRMMMVRFEGLREPHLEAVALARQLEDEVRLARILTSFASLVYYEGNLSESRAILEENIVIARRAGSSWDLLAALWTLSNTAREQGDFDVARRAVVEALKIASEAYGIQWTFVNMLLAAGYLLIRRGNVEEGVRLLGANEQLGESLNYRFGPALALDYNRYCSFAREQLGEAAFEAAWKRGRAMTPAEAIDFALTK